MSRTRCEKMQGGCMEFDGREAVMRSLVGYGGWCGVYAIEVARSNVE